MKRVLRNCKIWAAGYDFTGMSNALALDYGADMVAADDFGSDTHGFLSGLMTFRAQLEAFYDADSAALKIDDVFFPKVGADPFVVTFSPDGAVADPAYAFSCINASHSFGGAVGDAHRLSLGFDAGLSTRLYRGNVFLNGTFGASGNSGVQQLGAMSSDLAFLALHVFAGSPSGASFTATLQSDDAAGFLTPTTRISLSAVLGSAAPTGVIGLFSGTTADQYWRVGYTIAGTTPSFTVAAVAGIVQL